VSSHARDCLGLVFTADIMCRDWQVPWILVLRKLSSLEFISPWYSNELMAAADFNWFVSELETRCLCYETQFQIPHRTFPNDLSVSHQLMISSACFAAPELSINVTFTGGNVKWELELWGRSQAGDTWSRSFKVVAEFWKRN
jgi:hypothetical protein